MTGDFSGGFGEVEEGDRRRGSRKQATHLWQGVAPGSDGQTHRIFDRAQDWHARGRYFWTSGVARERSPDAGVESGMVTASRVPGEQLDSTVRAWVVLGLAGARARGFESVSLLRCSGWRLVSCIPIIIRLCRGCGRWTSGQPCRLCAPGEALDAPCCCCCVRSALCVLSIPEQRLTTPP